MAVKELVPDHEASEGRFPLIAIFKCEADLGFFDNSLD